MAIRNDRVSAGTPEIAVLKRDLHRRANGLLKASLENGYWIEAISIAESLMSDRIESYFEKHHEKRRITTLGTWSYELMKSKRLPKKEVDLFERVFEWSQERNKATHELVKVSERHKADWDERISDCMKVASEGKKLANEVNNWSRRKVKL